MIKNRLRIACATLAAATACMAIGQLPISSTALKSLSSMLRNPVAMQEKELPTTEEAACTATPLPKAPMKVTEANNPKDAAPQLHIGGKVDGQAPSKPRVIEVTTIGGANPGVVFEVVAPTRDHGRNTMTEPMTLCIARGGGNPTTEVNNVQPGDTVRAMDVPRWMGYYTFYIYFRNSHGDGEYVSKDALSGVEITHDGVEAPVWWDLRDEQLTWWTFRSYDQDKNGKSFAHYAFSNLTLLSDHGDVDEWMMGPGINMTPENLYEVTYNLGLNYPQEEATFEICYGKGSKVADMKHKLVGKTTLKNDSTFNKFWPKSVDCNLYGGDLDPRDGGRFYIGLHVTNLKPAFGEDACFIFYDLRVDVHNKRSPKACKEMAVFANPNGELEATIEGVAPTANCINWDLDEPMTVLLERDCLVVDSIENVNPGDKVSFVDHPAHSEIYTYTLTAKNQYGKGKRAEVTTLVGIGVPVAPKNVRAWQTQTEGMVTVAWDSVDHDTDGYNLNPDLVTYDIKDETGKLVMSDVVGNTTNLSYPVDEASFQIFTVTPKTESGMGASTMGRVVPVGTCVQLPIREFFAIDGTNYEWAEVNNDSQLKWSINDGSRWEAVDEWHDMRSADGDNGFMNCELGRSFEGGQRHALVSQNIDLTKAVSPVAEFQLWSEGPDASPKSQNRFRVYACYDGTRTEIGPFSLGDGVHGWNKYSVDLTPFVGKKIYLEFEAEMFPRGINVYFWVASIDNIVVREKADNQAPGAPGLLVQQDEADINQALVTVTMPEVDADGAATTEKMKVDLYRNGRIVASQDNLQPGSLFKYTDTVIKSRGLETGYMAVCANSHGEGLESTTNQMIGDLLPGSVSNMTMTEPEEGYLKITWDPVRTSNKGEALSPQTRVTYDILDSEGASITGGLTDTTFQYKAVSDGKQEFIVLSVVARTNAGASDPVSSALAVGAPLKFPQEDSFADASLNMPWGTLSYSAGAYGTLLTDDALGDWYSVEQDNGYVGLYGNASLLSGKLDVGDDCALIYWTSVLSNDDTNELSVRVWCDGDIQEIHSDVKNQLETQKCWRRVDVDLSEWADKVVQIEFAGTAVQYWWNMLDNIQFTGHSAISILNPETNATADVYNLQGMCVLRAATPEQVNSLPKGIYVYANKKILVR